MNYDYNFFVCFDKFNNRNDRIRLVSLSNYRSFRLLRQAQQSQCPLNQTKKGCPFQNSLLFHVHKTANFLSTRASQKN